MFKREFAMTDDDFRERRPGGDGESCSTACAAEREPGPRVRRDRRRENVSTDAYDRVKFGHGKSVDENLALRRGVVGAVPDLVVHPRDKTEAARIVALLQRAADSDRDVQGRLRRRVRQQRSQRRHRLVLRTHMTKLLAVSEANQTATVQPGMLGPDYEAALTKHAPFRHEPGYTCSHFPQSFELATVGGWIAAAGLRSGVTYYGDAAIFWSAPSGSRGRHHPHARHPRHATGPRERF
jgi:alkyldihydroxyacetonephosphate synthase